MNHIKTEPRASPFPSPGLAGGVTGAAILPTAPLNHPDAAGQMRQAGRLESALNELVTLSHRIGDAHDRLRNHVDGLLGPNPEKVPETPDGPVPEGLANVIGVYTRHCHELLSLVALQIERLERL